MYLFNRDGESIVSSPHEVNALRDRHFACNRLDVLFAAREKGAYPLLQVSLLGNGYASLHYFPCEGVPGFMSDCSLPEFAAHQVWDFPNLPHCEGAQLPASSITSLTIAFDAIRQFMQSNDLPSCLPWLEL
jgi:hypothetical protein